MPIIFNLFLASLSTAYGFSKKMSEKLSDSQILNLELNGAAKGEGEIMPQGIDELLHKFNIPTETDSFTEAGYGPEISILNRSSEVKPIDERTFTEEAILGKITNTWEESPDTLLATKAVRLNSLSGLVVTESFESTVAPEGFEKVTYQFCREGDYEGTSFDSTRIYRFRYRKPTSAETEVNYDAFMGRESGNPINKGRGTLELAGVGNHPTGLFNSSDNSLQREGVLKANEMVDAESGFIAVFDSVTL